MSKEQFKIRIQKRDFTIADLRKWQEDTLALMRWQLEEWDDEDMGADKIQEFTNQVLEDAKEIYEDECEIAKRENEMFGETDTPSLEDHPSVAHSGMVSANDY